MTDLNICGAIGILRQKPVFLSMALTFSLLCSCYLLQDFSRVALKSWFAESSNQKGRFKMSNYASAEYP